eukprot:2004470-Prymnesium_polylepis.1
MQEPDERHGPLRVNGGGGSKGGRGGIGGVGGGTGGVGVGSGIWGGEQRGSQSEHSVPIEQLEYSEPVPPSSQSPSPAYWHVSSQHVPTTARG